MIAGLCAILFTSCAPAGTVTCRLISSWAGSRDTWRMPPFTFPVSITRPSRLLRLSTGPAIGPLIVLIRLVPPTILMPTLIFLRRGLLLLLIAMIILPNPPATRGVPMISGPLVIVPLAIVPMVLPTVIGLPPTHLDLLRLRATNVKAQLKGGWQTSHSKHRTYFPHTLKSRTSDNYRMKLRVTTWNMPDSQMLQLRIHSFVIFLNLPHIFRTSQSWEHVGNIKTR